MSGWRPGKKKRLDPKAPMRITELKMSSGRIVTDPEEINRLLKADGFTVDEETGKVGLGPKLRPS